MMVGKKVELNIERRAPVNPVERLTVEGLRCLNRGRHPRSPRCVALRHVPGRYWVSPALRAADSGSFLSPSPDCSTWRQVPSATITPRTGEVEDLRDKTPLQIRELGVRLSFVPEDRLGMGLVGNMDITDNMMLRSYRRGRGVFLDRKKPHDLAEEIIRELEVATPDTHTPVRRLSGGNVQKVLVGREIAAAPTVLMAAYPVRGLTSIRPTDLPSAQPAEGARDSGSFSWGGSGRFAGVVRPVAGHVRRAGIRHRGSARGHKGGSRSADDGRCAGASADCRRAGRCRSCGEEENHG